LDLVAVVASLFSDAPTTLAPIVPFIERLSRGVLFAPSVNFGCAVDFSPAVGGLAALVSWK
jgi:hypothetical protein